MDSIISQVQTLAKGADAEARRKVIESLRDLAYSLETPEETYNRLELAPMEMALAKTATDLRIFDLVLENKKPITTAELVEKTGAAPLLLGRLLRWLASFRMLRETAEDTFEGNNISENLVTPLGKAMARFAADIEGPMVQAIPEFLKRNEYKDVDDPKHCPAQLGHHTDLTAYEFMKTHPEWAGDLVLMLTGRRVGMQTWIDVYPMKDFEGADPQRPLFVDVGGGAGPQCKDLKKKHPDLPGRLILQDLYLKVMLPHAQLPEGIEAMELDFFKPQPVKGAKYYYMRNIMHNYADERALQILGHLRDALAEDSLILIDDIVLPDINAPLRGVKMDIMMMAAHGAIERTEKQWNALFAAVGLKIVEIWTYRDITEGSSIISVGRSKA